MMDGFSLASPPRIFWNSRKRSVIPQINLGVQILLLNYSLPGNEFQTSNIKRILISFCSASARSLENSLKEEDNSRVLSDITKENQTPSTPLNDNEKKYDPKANLSEKRRALFEPLEPISYHGEGKHRTAAEELLPPPDFDSTSYPKGWLVGKKRKLVNVDVVESMRRIAVQEMNRKDREIDGLNEQLEEDAKCLERLQLQLLDERSKRADVERENGMLQNQISMLMNMLDENQAIEDEEAEGLPLEDSLSL